MDKQIKEWVAQTPLIDTHEHLIEESQRLAGSIAELKWLIPCDDWAYLFMHYLGDDFASAGMPADLWKRFLAHDTPTLEKYALAAPYWERAKHTGYGQAVRHTLRGLYDEDDLTAQSAPRLAEKYRAFVLPGLYKNVFQKANIEVCHVHSLQYTFQESEQPDLIKTDISFPAFFPRPRNKDWPEQETGSPAKTLDDWLAFVDGKFAEWGPRAVALKSNQAYSRRLDYAETPKAEAESAFSRLLASNTLTEADAKTLDDFLFRHCLTQAAVYGLPVKLHTGYYAGHSAMPLERLRQNASDLCPLLREFPETTFVLMHIGYPYQDEYIALAKHYPNAFIDMCWAWIINPAAGVRFLKEFLMAAPANKIFTFGGDYITVETVYGHSQVARQGIAQALSELTAEEWLRREETPALIERLMRGNALETFPQR